MYPGPRKPNSSSARVATGVGAAVGSVFLVALVLRDDWLGAAVGAALGAALGATLGAALGAALGAKLEAAFALQ